MKLRWRDFWQFARQHEGANGCLGLAFILLFGALFYRLITSQDDGLREAWLRFVNGPPWLFLVTGALACCAAVWSGVTWRRQVVGPLRELTRQISEEPEKPELHAQRACLYMGFEGRETQAVAECTRAIELDPDEWEFYDCRADAHWIAGNYDEAVLDRTRAITILAENDDEHWSLYAERSGDHLLAGNVERAIEDLTAALRLMERDEHAPRLLKADVLYRRAKLHRRLGDRQSADRDVREAHCYDRFALLDDLGSWRARFVRMIWAIVATLGLLVIVHWLGNQ